MVDKLLYRQIHPCFVQHNIVTSQAFKPRTNDKQLSVYDGGIIDAKSAWEHYAKSGLKSTGVMAVTEAECKSQGLPVIPDHVGYKEHVVIDFSDLSQKARKDAAKSLAADANKRGWCYRHTVSN